MAAAIGAAAVTERGRRTGKSKAANQDPSIPVPAYARRAINDRAVGTAASSVNAVASRRLEHLEDITGNSSSFAGWSGRLLSSAFIAPQRVAAQLFSSLSGHAPEQEAPWCGASILRSNNITRSSRLDCRSTTILKDGRSGLYEAHSTKLGRSAPRQSVRDTIGCAGPLFIRATVPFGWAAGDMKCNNFLLLRVLPVLAGLSVSGLTTSADSADHILTGTLNDTSSGPSVEMRRPPVPLVRNVLGPPRPNPAVEPTDEAEPVQPKAYRGLDSRAAKAAVEADGYKRVTIVGREPDGTWRAKAYRGTTEIGVRIDAVGNVSID
jgi:hypothetical protein